MVDSAFTMAPTEGGGFMIYMALDLFTELAFTHPTIPFSSFILK